ncbi:MAG: hypothetical protein RBG13Loki_3219 [Promethearchaeota archaeon CR_4]|nr:MAG: hypothetical protein RBG13Loki_3219 [Candidatus Lokiarchaeota archaeon CR_4]
MSSGEEMLADIREREWFHFGGKPFECPGTGEDIISQYLASACLPPPCDQCYKALIFWRSPPGQVALGNLITMVRLFPTPIRGKVNLGVVVFYFRTFPELQVFLADLPQCMESAGVCGKIQWRRACKEFQERSPEWWRDAKTFSPPRGTSREEK